MESAMVASDAVKTLEDGGRNPNKILAPSTFPHRKIAMESDEAPEEFTSQQGIEQHEAIKKVQGENSQRVARENKERRRKWAERRKQQLLGNEKKSVKKSLNVPSKEAEDDLPRLLPKYVVDLLAARERQTLPLVSDNSCDLHKPAPKKKKLKNFGPNMMILKDIPPPECLQNSLEFLRKKKSSVPRSRMVLKNHSQALRLVTNSGLLRN